MKLGVERAGPARRRHPPAAGRDRGDCPTAACASAPPCATATSRADRRGARALPAARRRRCSPGASGQLRNVATTAATCCSAPAAPTSRTSRSPATSARPGSGCPAREGDHRDLAILGHSPALRRHPPVRHGGRAGRARRDGPGRTGPSGERTIPCRAAPAARRRARARHGARARRADHRGRAAAAGARRALARTARCATARRSPSRRLGRRRPRRRRRRGPRLPDRASAASPTRRGGRGGAEEALRGAPADGGALRRAPPRPSSPQARPLRDNALQGPAGARNLLVRTLDRAARGRRDGTTLARRPSAPAIPRVEGREKVTGARPLRRRARRRGRRLRLARAGHDRPRRGHARVDTAAALRAAGRARRAHARERAAAARAATTRAVACCSRPRSPTAARSSRSWSPRRSRSRARRPRSCASTTTPRRTTSSCAPTTRLYTPEKVNAGLPDATRSRATSRRRWRGRRRSRSTRRTRRRPSTTTRWSRTPRSRVWDGGRPHALRLQPGRARASRDTIAEAVRARARARPRDRRRTSAAASAPRASPRPNVVARRAWPPRPSAARSSSRSPASRCSPSPATARRRSSACGSAPTPTAG